MIKKNQKITQRLHFPSFLLVLKTSLEFDHPAANFLSLLEVL